MARRSRRFCVCCGSGGLVYYPNLSNPKARNDERVLVYGCRACTKTFEKPFLMAVQIAESEDPLKTMRVQVLHH